jgi:hypothetical protein
MVKIDSPSGLWSRFTNDGVPRQCLQRGRRAYRNELGIGATIRRPVFKDSEDVGSFSGIFCRA